MVGVNVELELLRGSCVGAVPRALWDFADVCSFHERMVASGSMAVNAPLLENAGQKGAMDASIVVLSAFLSARKRDGSSPDASDGRARRFERAVARNALLMIGTILSRGVTAKEPRLRCALVATELVGRSADLVAPWLQVEAIAAVGRARLATSVDDSETLAVLRGVVQRALRCGDEPRPDDPQDSSRLNNRNRTRPHPARLAARVLVDDNPLQQSDKGLLSTLVEDVRTATSHSAAIDALAMLSGMCASRDDVGRWLAEESSWPDAVDRLARTVPTSPLDDEALAELIHFLSSAFRNIRPGDGSRQYLILVICRDRLVRLLDRSVDAVTADEPLVPRLDLRLAILNLLSQLLSEHSAATTTLDVCLPTYLEAAYTLAKETHLISTLCAQYIDPVHRYSINQTGQRVDAFLLSSAVEVASLICRGHASLAARTAAAKATREYAACHDTRPFYDYRPLNEALTADLSRALGAHINSRRWALPPRTTAELALLESAARAKRAVSLIM